MVILGNSVEIYFNESDPFEVEASGVASCYDKIILQVSSCSFEETVLLVFLVRVKDIFLSMKMKKLNFVAVTGMKHSQLRTIPFTGIELFKCFQPGGWLK